MSGRWLIAGTLLALTDCGPSSSKSDTATPRDCETAIKQSLPCSERYPDKNGPGLLLGCFPFSEPERISGAWVIGFETNEFYEGEKVSASLINKRVGDTQLEIDIPLRRPGPFPQLFQLNFIGRRSLCDMGFPHHIVVVDRIISRREVR
jgi:hypothetical protein